MFKRVFSKVKNWFSNLFNKSNEIPKNRKELPEWYQIALGEIGIKEVAGDGNNPRIIEYHYATSLKSTQDSVPWCSAFVCWCLQKANIRSSRSARARSYLTWGNSVLKPYEGCIVVLKRGRNPAQGHVGFFVKEEGNYIHVLGGNQGDEVNISKYAKSRLLDYREPASLA